MQKENKKIITDLVKRRQIMAIHWHLTMMTMETPLYMWLGK